MKWFEVLRVAAAMCFIGHGAFGIITKAGWLPFFAVFGIGPDMGYFFMPIIGAVDIALGLSMLRPTKAALAYMTFWGVWTALLRPLAGQGVPEFLERAGNYGVPLALFLAGLSAFPSGGWFRTITCHPPDAEAMRRIYWVLRVTTAMLLLGHGLLAASGKRQLVNHLAAATGDGGASTLALVLAQGGFEIGLALAVLLAPGGPLLAFVCAWKVSTELLFPLTGDYLWEWIERGGSYGAPLALMFLSAQPATARSTAPQLARAET